ncbi:MAG: alpha/beta fold hydrolase, partial [Candidatus Binatia bacterium]
AMIEAFGLDRPALVGHSFGASVCLRYATGRPRSLTALVLVDGRASFGEAGSRYMKLLGILGPAAYPTLEEAARKFRPLPKETIAEAVVIEHVARHGFRDEGGRWTSKFDRLALASQAPFDLENRIADLEFPVLFVRGEHSRVLSSATAARLAGICRRGSVVEIPGAHHHVPIDRPDRLGIEIREFLRRAAGESQTPPRVLS